MPSLGGVQLQQPCKRVPTTIGKYLKIPTQGKRGSLALQYQIFLSTTTGHYIYILTCSSLVAEGSQELIKVAYIVSERKVTYCL